MAHQQIVPAAGFNLVDDVSMNGSSERSNGPLVEIPGDRVGPTDANPAQIFYINAPQFHWQPADMQDHDARRACVQLAHEAFNYGRIAEERDQMLLLRIQDLEGAVADALGELDQLKQKLEHSLNDLWDQQTLMTTQWRTALREQKVELLTSLAGVEQMQRAELLQKNEENQQRVQAQWELEQEAYLRELAVVETRCTGRIAALEGKLRTVEQKAESPVPSLPVQTNQRSISALTARMDQLADQLGRLEASTQTRQQAVAADPGTSDPVSVIQQGQERMWNVLSKLEEEVKELTDAGKETTSEAGSVDVIGPSSAICLGGPSPTSAGPDARPASIQDSVMSRSVFAKRIVPEDVPTAGILTKTAAIKTNPQAPSSTEDLAWGQPGEVVKHPVITSNAPFVERTAPRPAIPQGAVQTAAGPQPTGVGQMKLDAPARYGGSRRPGVRVWLTQMTRYMRLMRYAPADWIDVVAMRVEGAASAWVDAVLQDVAAGRRPAFATWNEFEQAMIHRFEPVTENEEARKQLRALRQTKGVGGYIQRFQELQYRLPGMTAEEAFSAFVAGLKPHLQEHVGAHIQGDLEGAMAMALRMEIYHGGEGSKAESREKTGHKIDNKNKKGRVAQVDGNQGEGSVNALQGNQSNKKKGKKGKDKKKGKDWKPRKLQCHNCGGEHLLRDCKEWKEIKEKLRASGN